MKGFRILAIAATAAAAVAGAARAGGLASLLGPARARVPGSQRLEARVTATRPPAASRPTVMSTTPEPGPARFRMPWRRGKGLRLRLSYLDPEGEVQGSAAGYTVLRPGQPVRMLEAKVPAALRRSFPVYGAGRTITVEIELWNTGSRTLRRLWVAARQEDYQESGGAGPLIGSVAKPVRVARLGPGERVALRLQVRLSSDPRYSRQPVNFEQTHVLVAQDGADGRVVVVNAPHAGIVDPPR